MAKYYVDTCIWIDYWLNRNDNLRPLGEFALRFFNKVLAADDSVIYCDVIVLELSKYFPDHVNDIFAILSDKGLLEYVEIDYPSKMSAKRLSFEKKIPFGDALNIIVALKYDAILVTRDKHYLDSEAKVFKPEDL